MYEAKILHALQGGSNTFDLLILEIISKAEFLHYYGSVWKAITISLLWTCWGKTSKSYLTFATIKYQSKRA